VLLSSLLLLLTFHIATLLAFFTRDACALQYVFIAWHVLWPRVGPYVSLNVCLIPILYQNGRMHYYAVSDTWYLWDSCYDANDFI